MKILLADDEVQILKQLELLIDWQKYGYELVTAKNGREIVEILTHNEVDLLCLDMNMPIMNGLEVLDWIDENKIKVEVLIISCQDEFKIVKEAMKHKVLDYILKNTITPESILTILKEAKNKMKKDLDDSSKLIEMHHQVKQNRQNEVNTQFKYWLTKDGDFDFDANKIFADTSKNMNYRLFSMQVSDVSNIVRRYTSNNINEFYEMIENIFKNIFKKFEVTWVRMDDFTFLVLIQYNIDQASDWITCIKELHHDLYTILSIPTFILIADECDSLTKIKEGFVDKDVLESIIFFHGENKLMFLAEIKYISNSFNIIHELMKIALPPLEQENFELFELIIEQQIETIRGNKEVIPKQDILLCIRNMLFLASQTLHIDNTLFDINDLDTIEQMMIRLRKYFYNFTNVRQNKSQNHIVFYALNYIKENYSKDISLGCIANALNVSPAYLSRIFSALQDTTIVNYIADYRIQIAKKLIAETNLKFYDIASKVGFTSAITFSTIFKKNVGITPGEYREMIMNNIMVEK